MRAFWEAGGEKEANLREALIGLSVKEAKHGALIEATVRWAEGMLGFVWAFVPSTESCFLIRLRVENRSGGYIVNRIEFPRIAFTTLEPGDDEKIAWPHTLGACFEAKALKPRQSVSAVSPTLEAAFDFVDVFDDQGGLCLICHDDYGYLKRLKVERDDEGRLILSFVFDGLWLRPDEIWTTPWFTVALHEGDYRRGAKFYRRWAERAFAPPRVPPQVWERPQSNWVQWFARFSDLDEIFAAQRRGLVHGLIYQLGDEDSPFSLPKEFRGSDLDVAEANEGICKLGGIPAVWCIPSAVHAGHAHHALRSKGWAFLTRKGKLFTRWGDVVPVPCEETFVNRWRAAIRKLVGGLKFGEVRLDVGGHPPEEPCFSPSFTLRHRPLETPRAYKAFYKALLDEGRKVNPDFFLSSEHLPAFFWPYLATGTAHLKTLLELPKWRELDALPLPDLARFLLPQNTALLVPSVSDADLWVYGYGMGYGWYGGGAHWTFNPHVEEAEVSLDSLESRFRTCDLDWFRYHLCRVGFADAVIFGEPVEGHVLFSTDGGRTFRGADFPGPLLALSFVGEGRQVVLCRWLPASPGKFARTFYRRKVRTPKSLVLKVPLAVSPVRSAYLWTPEGVKKVGFHEEGRMARFVLPFRPDFALELCKEIHLELRPAKIVAWWPKGRVELLLRLHNLTDRPKLLTVEFQLPKPFSSPPPVEVALRSREERSVEVKVGIPDEIASGNWPAVAVVKEAGRGQIYSATCFRIYRLFDLAYKLTAKDGTPGCVPLGGRATLELFLLSTLPEPAEVEVNLVPPMGLEARPRRARLTIGPSDLFSFPRRDGLPKNAVRARFELICRSPPLRPLLVVCRLRSSLGDASISLNLRPRIRILKLGGRWRLLTVNGPPEHERGMGVGWRQGLPLRLLNPAFPHVKWPLVKMPHAFDSSRLPSASSGGTWWAVWRRWVYVPAEWRGADLGVYIADSGGPAWGAGFYNLVAVNGWVAGAVRSKEGVSLGPYVEWGKRNLLAVAQFLPRRLGGVYLFVTRALHPEAFPESEVKIEEEQRERERKWRSAERALAEILGFVHLDVGGEPDDEAIGGEAAHREDEGVYLWWPLGTRLPEGRYVAFVRAKGKGSFGLHIVNQNTGKALKVLTIEVDSPTYRTYRVGEFSYSRRFPLRLSDWSNGGLWVDAIWLEPAE